jgi:hypothetical protein
MALHAKNLIAMTRRYLREENAADVAGNQWSDLQLLNYIQEGIDTLVDDVVETDEDYFVWFQDYDFVSGQTAYDLPAGFIRVRKMEFIGGGQKLPILEARAGEDDESGIGVSLTPSSGNEFTYALVADQFHLDPTPGSALVSAVRLWQVRKPPDLIYGLTPITGSASTIRLSMTEDANGPAADPTDGIYNGAWIAIVAGTGAGQRRRITAYSGGISGTATVSPNWGTVPNSVDSIYALESMIPAPGERLPALLGAIAALNDIDEDSSNLQNRANAMHDRLISSVEQRTYAERVTQAWDPEDGTWPVTMG